MATSVTLEVLRQHLEEFGWSKYELRNEEGEREGLIFTGYRDREGKGHQIVIDPIVEKGVLRIMAPGVLMAPRNELPRECLLELTLALSAINARSTLSWWSYEPETGSVVVQVAMPIEENDLSYEQFNRSMNAVLWSIDTYADGLQAVADGAKKADELINVGLPMPTEADLEALRQMLAALEERLRSSRDGSQPDDEG